MLDKDRTEALGPSCLIPKDCRAFCPHVPVISKAYCYCRFSRWIERVLETCV